VLVVAYIRVTLWLQASHRQSQRIRIELFRAVLRQEIGWFDTNKAGELGTRLAELVLFLDLLRMLGLLNCPIHRNIGFVKTLYLSGVPNYNDIICSRNLGYSKQIRDLNYCEFILSIYPFIVG